MIHRSNHRSEIIGQNHRSYTQANLWCLDLWFGPMIVDLWWDLWYQPMISNLWCGPMIDDFDDLPPAAIVAKKLGAQARGRERKHPGQALKFSKRFWTTLWTTCVRTNFVRTISALIIIFSISHVRTNFVRTSTTRSIFIFKNADLKFKLRISIWHFE